VCRDRFDGIPVDAEPNREYMGTPTVILLTFACVQSPDPFGAGPYGVDINAVSVVNLIT
jgi:hypothetical protein